MIELFRPLLYLNAKAMGAMTPGAADPAAANSLMLVGGTIVLITAIWSLGGIAAAVWTSVDDWVDRRRQTARPRPDRPIRS